MSICYCGSSLSFEQCCQPIIENVSAETALQLMRSRYSAYCSGNVDYLRQTSIAANRKQFDEKEILQWLSQNRWIKLEIVSFDKGAIEDVVGEVEFKAFFADAGGKEHLHHEKSRFCKENSHWFYVDGQMQPKVAASSSKPQRNEACPCGSGKKYKNCCSKA